MPKRLLDTNKLIEHFKKLKPYGNSTPRDAEALARSVIQDFDAVIIAPVEVEFLGGIVDSHEMDLAVAFLDPFPLADQRRTLPEDWNEARRIAKHVVHESKRRQLCDCLINAVVNRLNIEPISRDRDLHRQRGRTRQHRP